MKKILESLKRINYKMFLALLVLGLIPTIYKTVRVFFMGDMPGEYSYSIAGQLSWVSLIFEVVSEAIILPLFFFIGTVINDKKELTNRVKTGMVITTIIYSLFAFIIIIFIEPLLNLMAVNQNIFNESATYIRIECIAYIFSTLLSFALVVLVSIGRDKYLYIFMGIKLILCLIFDTFLVSTLPISANLGVNGIGISNIIVNLLLLIGVLFILYKENIKVFNKEPISFTWIKSFLKKGSLSGLESFVRNFAYMVMVVRMINVVSEQGTYWMANNFIWGWLLLPVLQLGELIKKECSADINAVKNNTLGYFVITTIVCLLWVITIPLYKPFMLKVLNYSNADKLYELVMILLVFYMFYAFQNIFDSTFYGLGKIHYMVFETVITNTIYYGIAFVLYKLGVWTPSLTGIALLFGFGNVFDAIVSFIAYAILLKKEKISILV